MVAAVGLYGLIAQSVASRTGEIGIRMALGAQTWDVMRAVMWEGLLLGVSGLALGLCGAWAARRAARLDPVVALRAE